MLFQKEFNNKKANNNKYNSPINLLNKYNKNNNNKYKIKNKSYNLKYNNNKSY